MAVQRTALPPVEINTASSSHGPPDSFAHLEWFNTLCLPDALSTGPDLSTDGWIVCRSTLEAPPTLRNAPAVSVQETSFEPATATEVLNPCQSVGTTTYQHGLSITVEFDYASGLPFAHPLSFDSDAAESPSTSNSPIPSPNNNYSMSYELDDEQRTVLGKGNCTRGIQLSIKRASLNDAVEAEPEPKRARKCGRPRRQPTSSPTGASIGRRQPHNVVERKYRRSINAGLELLQRTVPTLPLGNSRGLGTPKPTKATVLASAIDYIKHIEAERDRLVNENERLRRSGLYTVEGEGARNFKIKTGQRQT